MTGLTALASESSQPANRTLIQQWVDGPRDEVVSAVVDASALLSTPAFDLDPGETRDAVEQAVEAGLHGIDHGMDEPEG